MNPIRDLALGASIAVLGCGGAQSGMSASQKEIASVQQQLTAGPWRLIDYRPAVPLDPMTQALLGAQLHTMIVTFDGHMLNATSPTITLSRPYTLQNVAGPLFDLVAADVQGGGEVRSHCALRSDGRGLTFQPATQPWNGAGVLEREGP